jgi:hypothetical protein
VAHLRKQYLRGTLDMYEVSLRMCGDTNDGDVHVCVLPSNVSPPPSKQMRDHVRSLSIHYQTELLEAYNKAIPVTGRGGAQGCDTSRLTDGGEIVSLTRRQAALYPAGFLVLISVRS